MKKLKQVLAIIGILCLVGLYVITLVFAITDNSETMNLFAASIFATILIPILLWVYSFIYKLMHKNDSDKKGKQ